MPVSPQDCDQTRLVPPKGDAAPGNHPPDFFTHGHSGPRNSPCASVPNPHAWFCINPIDLLVTNSQVRKAVQRFRSACPNSQPQQDMIRQCDEPQTPAGHAATLGMHAPSGDAPALVEMPALHGTVHTKCVGCGLWGVTLCCISLLAIACDDRTPRNTNSQSRRQHFMG